MRLLDHPRLGGEVLELHRHVLGLGDTATRDRIKRPRSEERDARLGRPADLDVHGILERRSRSDELPVVVGDFDEVPVQSGVETRRESRRRVRGEHRVREQDRVHALGTDELREHVDARLRHRRFELRVVRHVHARSPELAGLVRKLAHA